MKTARLPKSRVQLDGDRKMEFAPRNILVPVDFSPLSNAALDRAQKIARQFGSKLHLLHAVEPVIQPIDFAVVPPAMEQANMQQVAVCNRRLQSIKGSMDKQSVSCRAEVKLGKPWQVIVDSAKKAKSDLIILATHGRTGARHLLLGSTAERVVQHAPCSVLVVR